MRERITEVVVVHDARCPGCAGIATQLEAVLRYPVIVRSCYDPALADVYPTLRGAADVLTCRTPALGIARADGSIRWWTGRRAALGALPAVRLTRLPAAVRVLRRVLVTRRAQPVG